VVALSPPGYRRRAGGWWTVTVASILGVGLASSETVQRLDWALHDRFVALAAYEPSPPEGIVIVAVDQPSVEQLRLPWPWPRRVHAALVRALASAGARTIVFDLVFDEPAAVAEDDGILREAITRAGNVVLAMDRRATRDPSDTSTRWAGPISSLATAASGLGVASLPMDGDGVVRRYAVMVGDQLSLAGATESSERSDLPTGGLIPFDGRPGAGIRTVSYYRVLQSGQLPQGFFRGKTVLVGRAMQLSPATSQADDSVRTPVGAMAAVEIHASALDALARGRFVGDPFAGAVPMTLLLLPIAALSGWLVLRAGAILSIVVLLLATTAWCVAGYALRAHDFARLPIVSPVAAATTALVVAIGYLQAVRKRDI
jgi:adenylate cyclase